MRQRGVCRGLVLTFLGLGVGMLLGWRLWFCWFAEVTGLPCPGCGLTRAMLALGRGEWGLAWRFHPLAPGFVVLGGWVILAAVMPAGWVAKWADKVEVFERRTKLTAIFLMVLIVFGLLRMTGFWYPPGMFGTESALFRRGQVAK